MKHLVTMGLSEIRERTKDKLPGNWLLIKDLAGEVEGVPVWEVELIRGSSVRRCRFCGAPFTGRRGAQTCSGKCRAAQWRRDRQANGER